MTSLRYGRITPTRLMRAARNRVRRRAEARNVATEGFPAFPPAPTDARAFVGIGPANFAGQGFAWARALETHLPGVRAESFATTGAGLGFRVDRPIDPAWYRDPEWQRAQRHRVLDEYTHVIAEAVRPVFGLAYGDTLGADLPVLAEAGKPVAVLLHGSEVRDPDRHAAEHKWSPFRDTHWDLADVLRDQSRRLRAIVEGFGGLKLASTPDLIDDVPDAVWFPVVVDMAEWAPGPPVLQRERPIVVHAPSNPRMKGTAMVEPYLAEMHESGVIEYRRLEGVPPERMPAEIADADVVLDQFAIGSYGVAAVQAMACERVVVGHVTERVRARLPEHLPMIEATPDSLVDVISRLVADRESALELALAGRRFASEYHGGGYSASVVEDWIDGRVREGGPRA